jgi:hypothetical protein
MPSKLRVSINALDLVTRQLAREDGSDVAEAKRLAKLLACGLADRTQPRAVGQDRKRRGRSADAGIIDHLWQTTMDKLAVDQPNYASYKRELGRK